MSFVAPDPPTRHGSSGLASMLADQSPGAVLRWCRGCTCVEQSVLGGVAHLLNFDGTGEAAPRCNARQT